MSGRPDTRSNVVLLVEDNPDDEALARRAFTKSRLANEILVARDGVEAIALLLGTEAEVKEGAGDGTPDRPRRREPLPQLVLLDLKLPRVDGLEVLRRIRGHPRTRTLPVVVLTSSDEERDLVESYRLGVNSYIRKPVDFQQFARVIEEVGLYWLVLNLPPPSGSGKAGDDE